MSRTPRRHLPLGDQLEEYGVRQFEIDVMADPDGGLYSTPAALEILGIEGEPAPEMLEPGFKVRHIQDVDFDDDVRGDAETLEAAVLDDGWPTVGEARGRVMFSLVDTGPSKDVYTAGAPSLEGRVLFTSGSPGDPDAAFVRVDDSLEDGAELDEWAADGYLIRTRTDVPGVHAVEGDTSLRDSALGSGGHFLSTDYYWPDPEIGTGYVVELPGGAVARCNPVTAPSWCTQALFQGVG